MFCPCKLTLPVFFLSSTGNQGKPINKVEAYDLSSNKWVELGNIPTTHCSCAYIMWDSKLYVIGGLSLQGPSNSMEAIGCK